MKGQSPGLSFFRFAQQTPETVIPRQIKLGKDKNLEILWDDAHESVISLRRLRDTCPCASCQGETVLLHHYEAPEQAERPGKYELVGAEQVGSYALQLTWKDGHSTGIYTWERLRSLCECSICRPAPKSP
jgi:DUF971 family protein